MLLAPPAGRVCGEGEALVRLLELGFFLRVRLARLGQQQHILLNGFGWCHMTPGQYTAGCQASEHQKAEKKKTLFFKSQAAVAQLVERRIRNA